MTKTYLFLDTNIFLHCQSFQQIKWERVAAVNEVVLVIAPVVIRELDKHKHSEIRRIRDRARTVQVKILEILKQGIEGEVDDKVKLLFLPREPKKETFESLLLDAEVWDDCLIASIKEFQRQVSDGQTILLTNDSGPMLKARVHEIKTLAMPSQYLLPEPTDSLQEELNELRKANLLLKNQSPELSVKFINGKSHMSFRMASPLARVDEEVDSRVRGEAARYPKIVVAKGEQLNVPTSNQELRLALTSVISRSLKDLMASSFAVKPEEIEKYNEGLESYYNAFKEYLHQDLEFKNRMRRLLKLELILSNSGRAPAKDIDVFLHFPDGMEILKKIHLPEAPKKPISPYERVKELFSPSAFRFDLPSYIPKGFFGNTQIPNVSTPKIRKTNSFEVEINVDYLKHNQQEKFDRLFIVFDSFENANSFPVDYKIQAANLPDEVKGALNVVVEKSDAGSADTQKT